MPNTTPYIVQFDSIGSSEIGYISVAEESAKIPFKIMRAYWTYYTPQSVKRGGHANISKELVLVAVAGSITVNTELINGGKSNFTLDSPNIGLYMPKLCWHTMQYSHNAVQLVIASTIYNSQDYIRDYEKFTSFGLHP